MKKLISVILAGFISLSAFCKVPAFTGWVVDDAGVIDEETKGKLTSILSKFDKETGNQFAVLTIDSLNGESIEDYSLNVAEAWGLGQKDKDNGVLFVIAVKDKNARIEVGYGLNPVLTATKTGMILNQLMFPEFKKDDFGTGILYGVAGAIREVVPEFDFGDTEVPAIGEEPTFIQKIFPVLFTVGFFAFFIIIGKLTNGPLIRHKGLRKYIFWKSVLGKDATFTDAWLANRFLGDGKGFFDCGDDDDDDGPHYLSGGGKFGGGGFHGGGGGHFGGGGSSGRW